MRLKIFGHIILGECVLIFLDASYQVNASENIQTHHTRYMRPNIFKRTLLGEYVRIYSDALYYMDASSYIWTHCATWICPHIFGCFESKLIQILISITVIWVHTGSIKYP